MRSKAFWGFSYCRMILGSMLVLILLAGMSLRANARVVSIERELLVKNGLRNIWWSTDLGVHCCSVAQGGVSAETLSEVTSVAGQDTIVVAGSGFGSASITVAGSPLRYTSSSFLKLTVDDAFAFSISDLDLTAPPDATVLARLIETGGNALFNVNEGVTDFEFSAVLDPSKEYEFTLLVEFDDIGLDVQTSSWSVGSFIFETSLPEPSTAILLLTCIVPAVARRRR